MKIKLVFALFAMSFITYSYGNDQNNISRVEDIVVYGNFTKRNYYSDSNNSTVLNSADFADYQATHFEELIQTIPGLNSTKGTSRTRYFTIRGIGERSEYEGMPNYSVGVLIDDIDYSGISSIGNLGGISQVEVYKGAQSTRMGPSALAGMIHMNSKSHESTPEGSVLLSIESFNTFKEQLFYSTPITKQFGTSISLSKTDSDGYIRNKHLNRDDTSGLDELSLRSKSIYKKEDIKGTFNIHYHKSNNGYDYFVQDNSLETRSDKPGEDDQDVLAGSIKLEYGKKSLRFVSIFSHLDDESLYSYDEDWGSNEQWNSTPGYNANYDFNIEFLKNRRHYYLEQRAIVGGNLIIGLYHKNSYERFKEIGFEDGAIRKNVKGNYNTQNNAFYIQNTNKVLKNTFLDYGLRIENRNAIFKDSEGNRFSPNETMNGGNISYRIQHDSKNMNFISVSKGFKTGGFNTQSNVEEDRRSFDQEALYNLEIGSKNQWKENLKTSAALFYMLRENVQVRTSYQDDPNDPSSYTFYTDNATSGKSYGLELELGYFNNSGIDIKTNLSFLKTEYDDYEIEDTNLRGREFPNAPEYKLNTFIRYSFSDQYFISTNILISDSFFYSNSHNQVHPKHEVVDLTIGYLSYEWELSVWSKNIFDEKTFARGFYFANEPPAFEDQLYTQRNPPRTFGITAKYNF